MTVPVERPLACKAKFAHSVSTISPYNRRQPCLQFAMVALSALSRAGLIGRYALDILNLVGIMVLTLARRGPCAKEDPIRPEGCRASTGQQPQPPPKQGRRPALRFVGFLRPARPRPGQVLDGAASAGRRRARQPQRGRVRSIASVVLPGPGFPRARGTTRTAPEETRTAPVPQTPLLHS